MAENRLESGRRELTDAASMRREYWPKLGIAVLFVMTVAGPWWYAAFRLGGGDISGTAGLVLAGLTLVICLLTGYTLSWLAIPLLVVPVLLVMPLGVDPQDSDRSTYWWLLLFGPMFFIVLAVLVGGIAREWLSPTKEEW